jgi:two-component system, chemotaxis family, chemotaxis protein CheY
MKVVLIDDSTFMRRLIRTAMLETNPQAQIVEFGDASEALTALPELMPDLITLDMLMPGMNGLAFLAQLRANTLNPRVIVITADVQKTIRQKCLELGVVDFIEKPITLEKLQLALGKLITV